MSDLRRIGSDAEDQAAEHLLDKGYTIITRRYHARWGEIDIIALYEETLVFVEVKARLSPGFSPEEAVGPRKIVNLCKAAARFRRETADKRPFRFDLIAIDRNGLRHYEGCFEPLDLDETLGG